MSTETADTTVENETEKETRKVLTKEEKQYLNSLPTESDSFTFAVPDTHADSKIVHFDGGKPGKKKVSFLFPIVTEDTVAKVMEIKGWTSVDMVNDALKANARSNEYQLALAPYRPSQRTPEQIKEDIIRDYVRSGISEDIARKQVEALFSAANG